MGLKKKISKLGCHGHPTLATKGNTSQKGFLTYHFSSGGAVSSNLSTHSNNTGTGCALCTHVAERAEREEERKRAEDSG